MMWFELWILCGLVSVLIGLRVEPISKLTIGELLLSLACILLGPILLFGVLKVLFEDCLDFVIWEKPIDKQEK